MTAPDPPGSSPQGLQRFLVRLRHPSWTGVAAIAGIVAAAAAIIVPVAIWLASPDDGQKSRQPVQNNSINGNCNAQGSNNKVC
jgi:hypothetical protein